MNRLNLDRAAQPVANRIPQSSHPRPSLNHSHSPQAEEQVFRQVLRTPIHRGFFQMLETAKHLRPMGV